MHVTTPDSANQIKHYKKFDMILHPSASQQYLSSLSLYTFLTTLSFNLLLHKVNITQHLCEHGFALSGNVSSSSLHKLYSAKEEVIFHCCLSTSVSIKMTDVCVALRDLYCSNLTKITIPYF